MKKTLFTLIFAMGLIALIVLFFYNNETSVYQNREFGFTMTFPKSWRGQFEITSSQTLDMKTVLTISSKVNKITDLGVIVEYTQEEWKDMDPENTIPVEWKLLDEDDVGIFILYLPSSVVYDIDDQKSVEAYYRMREDLEQDRWSFAIAHP